MSDQVTFHDGYYVIHTDAVDAAMRTHRRDDRSIREMRADNLLKIAMLCEDLGDEAGFADAMRRRRELL